MPESNNGRICVYHLHICFNSYLGLDHLRGFAQYSPYWVCLAGKYLTATGYFAIQRYNGRSYNKIMKHAT